MPLIEVRALSKSFRVRPGLLGRLSTAGAGLLRAVVDVSFSIEAGSTLALVGESGCGKSTLARMMAGLTPPTSGQMRYAGTALGARAWGVPEVRAGIQMVFQNPYASLNPRWTVGRIVAEGVRRRQPAATAADVARRSIGLLEAVGLAPGDAQRLPHQFSGGQRQRICLARALAMEPRFLICDEPTSALDVSVQAQVLNLMKDLQERHGLTYLFITHNLAIVNQMADEVGVMYLGRLVESGTCDAVLHAPRHPYTRMLLSSIPDLARPMSEGGPLPPQELPSPLSPPSGCTFHPRCPHRTTQCESAEPPLLVRDGTTVRCHLAPQMLAWP
jgi:peptide/nickel transport system ATP-binding protein